MKADRKQTAAKLTVSKIGTHVMVRVVTKYGKWCLQQVVHGYFFKIFSAYRGRGPWPCPSKA